MQAATEPGHQKAGHGLGDPFVGTPFDLPRDASGDSGGGGGGGVPGEDPNLSGGTRPSGVKGRALGDAWVEL